MSSPNPGRARRGFRVVTHVVRGNGTPTSSFLRVLGGLFTTWFLVVGVVAIGLLFSIAGGEESGAQSSPLAASCAVEAQIIESGSLPHGLTEQDLNDLYMAAASAPEYPLGDRGWAVLKAINRIETDFGRNVATSSAGAKGWMQFMPPTWEAYRVDVRHERGGEVRDVGGAGADWNDPTDAIHSAANYLHALLEENDGDWRQAVWGYNHSWEYVDDVLSHSDAYQGQCTSIRYVASPMGRGSEAKLLSNGKVDIPPRAPKVVQDMIHAANRIANKPYLWGGGHPPSDEVQNGYDCSGYTMYVLREVGLWGNENGVASWFKTWGDDRAGKWVTIYANDDHVFMVIAGRRFDSGGTGRPGSAWRADMAGVELSEFTARHPPGL